MRVLSLFDWIACWYEALLRAGFTIEKYYASEIDKYAIQIAQKNHPDIIQIWDVCNVKWEDYQDIDLLIWGSPCQWFSMAWKMLNFDDPRSKLFFEFVRILKECKPKYFLLENVKMKKEWIDVISEQLWVKPIEINSSLVSAQNRKRLYRTNIPWVIQPQDKQIFLKDVLQEQVDDKYYLTEKQYDMIDHRKGYERPLENVKWPNDKIWTITTHVWKRSNGLKLVSVGGGRLLIKQATKQWYIVAEKWDGISLAYPNSTTRRWRVSHWKSNTLTTQGDSCVYDGTIRRLTPIECERLQTLPDNYTEWISESQRYKALWNWWTVDVLAHIFRFISNI